MNKKILFILCTIIILCVGSIVNAATLKDITNTKYEDSVNTLITLGVVNGYPEDNTYRPNNAVTRAEMAKLMVVCLGEEGNVAKAAKEAPKFKDVKSSDWEFGYVNLASKLGIINGYPDGTFGSKNTVSYAEATAMIIRALEYEDEVNKRNEVWPNNYINQAKKLSLYTSVGTVNSNDGAKRGNVAILLWNMLRTGVCTVVGQNDAGLVYGEGKKLLNTTIPNFVYLEDALVDDVTFDETFELAELEIKGEKTIKPVIDAIEATEMYGRKFNILYNTSSKKMVNIEEADDFDVKEGDVANITSTKIYIDGANSNGYKLPDNKNILLYGIDDIDDAVTATLIFEGSTLKYVIGYAPEEVYLALVTNTEVTVNNKDGIKLLNYKSSSEKSYALKNKNSMPNIDDVILYYLTDKDELVILDKSNVFNSTEVDSSSSTKIVAGKYTYKISDEQFTIAKVKTASITSMSAASIEKDVDSIDLISFGGYKYYIVYIGGVDKAYEELEKDIDSACNTLSNYIKTVKTAYNSETTYTLATYTKFANAYDEANSAITTAQANTSVTNLNKINTAYANLKSTYGALKKITDLPTADRADENALISAKRALRNIVNGTTTVDGKKVTTCVSNKSTYDTATYATFETALNNAKSVLKSPTATHNKIDTATTNLKNAIKGLLTKTEDTNRDTALAALTTKIADAEKLKQNSAIYTQAAYNIFLSILEDAKTVKNSSTSTEAQIKSATNELNEAIIMLTGSSKESSLNSLLRTAQEKLNEKEIYMTATVNALETAFAAAEKAKEDAEKTSNYGLLATAATDLQKAIDGLLEIDAELGKLLDKAKNYKLQDIKDKVGSMTKENLNTYEYSVKELKIAELDMAINTEQAMIDSRRGMLNSEITLANKFTKETDWNSAIYVGTYNDMVTARTAAIAMSDKTDATSVELKTAYDNLHNALALKSN